DTGTAAMPGLSKRSPEQLRLPRDGLRINGGRVNYERNIRFDEARHGGALSQKLRIGAEIVPPAFAVLAGREIKAAGGQDGAGKAGPLRAVELGMRNVGCDVGRAGRMTHEIDALRVGAVLGGMVGDEAHG